MIAYQDNLVISAHIVKATQGMRKMLMKTNEWKQWMDKVNGNLSD